MSFADEKPCVRSKLSQEQYKSDIDTMIASPDLSGGDAKVRKKEIVCEKINGRDTCHFCTESKRHGENKKERDHHVK